MAGISV
ncbi:hypothetical protein D049_2591A, partial [Vibrio parahaemolyticus VPTS-2010]